MSEKEFKVLRELLDLIEQRKQREYDKFSELENPTADDVFYKQLGRCDALVDVCGLIRAFIADKF